LHAKTASTVTALVAAQKARRHPCRQTSDQPQHIKITTQCKGKSEYWAPPPRRGLDRSDCVALGADLRLKADRAERKVAAIAAKASGVTAMRIMSFGCSPFTKLTPKLCAFKRLGSPGRLAGPVLRVPA